MGSSLFFTTQAKPDDEGFTAYANFAAKAKQPSKKLLA